MKVFFGEEFGIPHYTGILKVLLFLFSFEEIEKRALGEREGLNTNP